METKRKGLSARTLKWWGLVLTLLWVLGRTMTRILLRGASGEALLTQLEAVPYMMGAATAILILESLAVCAVPIYAALLLEGVSHTQDMKQYVLRVGLLALVSEIPYDLLMTGKFLDFSVQNPLLGLVVCQAVVYFWNRCAEPGMKSTLIRAAVILAAAAWCLMLRVEYGLPMLLCTAILWMFRKDRSKWGLGGMMGAAVSILLSPFFLAAPMGAILLHFYNGQRGEGGRGLFYIAYPLLLLAGAAAAMIF